MDQPDGADAAVRLLAQTQASIDAVGLYLKERFPDPKRLTKAIHDYVVLRLHYDDDALAKILAKDYEHTPAQTAEAVFAAKTGVCEGYARLMVALGKAAGVEIAYVTGYIRDAHRRVSAANANGTDDTVKAALEGYLHAWNAVKLDGQWQLVDATWDDPKVDPKDPAPLRSTYLFTPPKYFRYDHLPEDPAWQLTMSPITPGDFVRQPLLTPSAGELGLTLVEPTRSQVTVHGDVELVVDNPYKVELAADATLDSGAADAGGRPVTPRATTRARWPRRRARPRSRSPASSATGSTRSACSACRVTSSRRRRPRRGRASATTTAMATSARSSRTRDSPHATRRA